MTPKGIIKGTIYKNNELQYDPCTYDFRKVLEKSTPLKIKMIRGKQNDFMTKGSRKGLRRWSRIKIDIYTSYQNYENYDV